MTDNIVRRTIDGVPEVNCRGGFCFERDCFNEPVCVLKREDIYGFCDIYGLCEECTVLLFRSMFNDFSLEKVKAASGLAQIIAARALLAAAEVER